MHSHLISNMGWKEINPVQSGWQRCARGHAFGPAVRDHYLLHYVVSGQGVYQSPRGEYALSAGDLFVIRPEESTYYIADAETPWYYIWVGFGCPASLRPLLARDSYRLPLAEPVFREIAALSQIEAGRELVLCAKVYEILALLSRQTPQAASRGEAVRQAVNYMQTGYMRELSIARLAEMLNMNRSHFSQVFKEVMGEAPQAYLVRLRQERALDLLRSGRFSVSEVALATGYGDVFLFSRAFKRYYGVSPREWRRGEGLEDISAK